MSKPKNYHKIVEKVNNMKYDKSRKENAEFLRGELQKIDIICGAINAQGKICPDKPSEGSKRCHKHGGASTGAKTPEGRERSLAQLNPRARLVHGLYSRFVMSSEEEDFYIAMMNHYIDALDLDPANTMILDRACRNFLLNQRKEIAEANEMINGIQFDIDYDTKFLKYMQALGLDRKFNVSKEHKDNPQGTVDIALLFGNE